MNIKIKDAKWDSSNSFPLAKTQNETSQMDETEKVNINIVWSVNLLRQQKFKQEDDNVLCS